MKTYTIDAEMGVPYATRNAVSVKAGASSWARCQTCRAADPMIRREGEGSFLPLAHTRGCRILDAETFQLLADLEGAAEHGDGALVVFTRRPTFEEAELLEAMSHDIDPDGTCVVTVEGSQRRRCWVTITGTVAAW